ncbi:MAG: Holliday junction resolvase RuvX [Candidatus Latescibacteria bacterium]|jgi:putative Holliday junction resolvase|nr:Holliday junction resolvase RuvX [Candidatus Latescibacterota bacterium]
MDRILAVDYGRRRIGLAVSDELGLTAQGLPTVSVVSASAAAQAVAEVAAEWSAAEVVVGLPLNMDGSHGPMADAAEAFADALRDETGLPVSLWDERLTTQSARRVLKDAALKYRRQRGTTDRIAAGLLLESYLQARASRQE